MTATTAIPEEVPNIKVNGCAYQRVYADARMGLAISFGKMYFL